MNICFNDHTEICYEAIRCPFCEAMKAWNADLDGKDQIISVLKADNAYLEKELAKEPVIRAIEAVNQQ